MHTCCSVVIGMQTACTLHPEQQQQVSVWWNKYAECLHCLLHSTCQHQQHRQLLSSLPCHLQHCLQSPEKFQRQLAELTAAVEAERGQVEDADRACSELAARQEMVGKVKDRSHVFSSSSYVCGKYQPERSAAHQKAGIQPWLARCAES